jgi:hypothetical protein
VTAEARMKPLRRKGLRRRRPRSIRIGAPARRTP